MLRSALTRLFPTKVPKVSCCGIVGVVATSESLNILTRGIQILQNRGYDSAGIATVSPKNSLAITKYASVDGTDHLAADAIRRVVEEVHSSSRHSGHCMGVAHTRWATHGPKTDQNAHPHSDFDNKIVLVHNGTVHNYLDLKQDTLDHWPGLCYRGSTDSEVIVNRIAYYMKVRGNNFGEAFRSTVAELSGTWGIVAMHRDYSGVMMVARLGSPLLLGVLDGGVLVASEPSAMVDHCTEYVEIDDGESLEITIEKGARLLGVKTRHVVPINHIELVPDPWDYWTDREIDHQPQAALSALGGRINSDGIVKLGGLDSRAAELLSSNIIQTIFVGCGTSFNSCLLGLEMFKRFRQFDFLKAVDASEFSIENDLPLKLADKTILIFVSQSGETMDILDVTKKLKRDRPKALQLSVVNVVGSALARSTNLGVYIGAGREVAVASTKAFTCQSIIIILIGLWFDQQRQGEDAARTLLRHSTVAGLKQLPDAIKRQIAPSIRKQLTACAATIKDAKSMFILGKGLCLPIAQEGALKIKEVSYVHAEAYPAGALKHGPFALLDPSDRTPCILLVLDDENVPLLLNVAEQVVARQSRLIVISNCSGQNEAELRRTSDFYFDIPDLGLVVSALLMVVPMQIIAFYLAVIRGFNPDKPRGLAKTVTVW